VVAMVMMMVMVMVMIMVSVAAVAFPPTHHAYNMLCHKQKI